MFASLSGYLLGALASPSLDAKAGAGGGHALTALITYARSAYP